MMYFKKPTFHNYNKLRSKCVHIIEHNKFIKLYIEYFDKMTYIQQFDMHCGTSL